jgi:AcrR family transcriptional regulator
MDRRAVKKAQTRELVRSVAQQMFLEHGFDAVTIADIARRADVAVQTVFNHIATKEDLFFEGQTPWLTGPADAVRLREPSVPALVALRGYLVEEVSRLVGSFVCPDRRAYVATINGSDALRARERELVYEAERRLGDALVEAWTADDAIGAPSDPHTVAPITAAVWLSAARVMVIQQRPADEAGFDPARAGATRAFAERLLSQMEAALDMIHGFSVAPLPRPGTGWPEIAELQAG